MKSLPHLISAGMAGLALLTSGCPPAQERINLMGKVEDERYTPPGSDRSSIYELTVLTERGKKVINVIDGYSCDELNIKENVDFTISKGMNIKLKNIYAPRAGDLFLSVCPNSIELVVPSSSKSELETIPAGNK